MKAKRMAGLALLLSVVMLGAFISGCIDQGNTTGMTSPSETGTLTGTPSKTETSTATRTETTTRTSPSGTQTTTETPDMTEKKILELVSQYENAIDNAKVQLEKTGFEVKDGEFSNWDAKAEELRRKADNEKDPKQRTAMLYDLARLRYYELLNLQSAVGISAIEKAYWENATTGEPIEAFYNRRGDFFYAGDDKITKMDVPQMVEKMYSITKGYELESIEIYQVGTGSVLVRSIREGGRIVGAGLAAIKIHAKGGMTIKTDGNDFGVLRLVDPNTGETVMKVAPDEKGTYTVPPVNVTLLGITDGGFCYRPLPIDENHMDLMPITDEVTLDEVLCAGGLQIAPFVFDPTDGGTGPYAPAPLEDLYLMPGQYTVQTFAMKADLKQLAEQLVNINVRMGGTKVETKRATKALDAFQNAVTSVEASTNTPLETTCSCTVSPLLKGIFKETFGGDPFRDVPSPERTINITDFGTGPFIPIPAGGLKDHSAEVKVFVVSDGKGNVNIIVDESGISEGERLDPSYLNRIFVEVVTGRNPQTGKEARIAAVKVLNTDGTIAVRGTIELPEKNLVVSVVREGREGKLSNEEGASDR